MNTLAFEIIVVEACGTSGSINYFAMSRGPKNFYCFTIGDSEAELVF